MARRAPLLLASLLVALIAAASAAKQSDFPACWFSGLPPARPNVTVTRCLDAAEWTCCSDCDDQKYALVEASTDGRLVLNQISAGLGDKFSNQNMMICAQFSRFQQCQFLLEQIVCATGCNPDSGNYFKTVNDTRVMQVCNPFSQTVYENCKGLSLPGIATLDKFFPSAERFMEDLFGKVGTAFGVYNFTVAVTPDGTDATQCYNGPKKLPPMPFCCDPLPVPVKECPAKVMNFTEYPNMGEYINRTITDPQCDAYRCSSSTGGSSSFSTSSLAAIIPTPPENCIATSNSNSTTSSNTGGSAGAADSSTTGSSGSSSSSGAPASGSNGGKGSNRLHSMGFAAAAVIVLPVILAVL